MVYSFYNSNDFSSPGYDVSRLISPSLHDYGASYGVLEPSHALILESEKIEQVNNGSEDARVGKNYENSDAKALAALKNHSEAERRRRERINGHLATLRGLVSSTDKMDKATILAKVVSQVKELQRNAMEASKGLLIPTDFDEVEVEPYEDHRSMSYKASICCDYRPEILFDLRHTLDALELQLVRAETSTLEGRMKNVFVYRCCKGKGDNNNTEACQALARNVQKALSRVIDKASNALEYSLRASLPCKRRRICLLEN
ncbi:putative transcription factor bHLH107 [Arachis duranensis]|uniref:Transcription factor bHLH107 n=1 Tax=Arachis duranensis TaxID=130453 RepID=A0A6P4CSG2_ARADU|nr:putative transcription factor bHLH107 [Arachis duranensis]XP_057750844.1 putative transcription factor bHLH107 [Arachis stenosperma]